MPQRIIDHPNQEARGKPVHKSPAQQLPKPISLIEVALQAFLLAACDLRVLWESPRRQGIVGMLDVVESRGRLIPFISPMTITLRHEDGGRICPAESKIHGLLPGKPTSLGLFRPFRRVLIIAHWKQCHIVLESILLSVEERLSEG